MKTPILNAARKTMIQQSLAAVLAMASLAGCVKNRPAQFDYREEDKIFSLTGLRSAGIEITVGNQQSSLANDAGGLRASSEIGTRKVEKAKTPDKRLNGMFEDLWVTARPEARYQIRLEVNQKYLTAYKTVVDESELTALEGQIASKVALPSGKTQALVPLFQYQIEAYGVVKRALNDLREETSSLEMIETEWSAATHVKVTPLSTKRLMVTAAVDGNNQSESRQIFLRDRVDGALLTRTALQRDLNVQIAAPALVTSTGVKYEDPFFLTQIDGDRLSLYEVTTSDSRTLTDADRKALAQGGNDFVEACPAGLKERLPESMREKCVQVLRYRIPVHSVVADRTVEDEDGTRAPTVRYIDAPAGKETTLVRIVPNTQPESVGSEGLFLLDPRDSLAVESLRGSEFLLRRTLEDSPNGFQYTFAGTAGPLEVVRFVFEENRVRVVRADLIIDRPGSTVVDRETVMSIPARYYKPTFLSETGQTLSKPRYVPADHTTADAVARVDWTHNQVPNVLSPLNYYELEECFTGANEKEISDVDQRLSGDGILNFTLTSHYSANPAVGCADLWGDYFDANGVQAGFTFKERVSFKRYVKGTEADAEKPLLDVPYDAQKKLGFGLFTYNKVKPNTYGETHLDGTQIPLPAVFNLKQGKKIVYVLAGMPATGELRDAVIKATREVVADWNVAMHKAFAGTPMDRSGDYMELLVEGEDAPDSKIGDLDKNYLYWVGKQTDAPILGLGGASPNPRSGVVENAAVFIYGGNMLGSVKWLRERAVAIKDYAAASAPQLIQGETPAEDGAAGGAPAGGGDAADTGTVTPGASGIPQGHMASMNLSPDARALLARIQTQRAQLGAAAGQLKGKVTSSAKDDLRRLVKEIVGKNPALTDALGSSLRDRAEAGRRAGQHTDFEGRDRLLTVLRKKNKEVALYQALTRAMAEGKAHDLETLTIRVNEELVRLLQGQIPAAELAKLRGQVARAKNVAAIKARMEAAGICVHDAPPVLESTKDTTAMSDTELLMALYKPTLAHEIGHNLGLRHNFIATFDKANWTFDKDDTSKRDYSSVMDYSSTDHETYDGLGPYDVQAIRAAYTGLLEVHPQVVEQATAAGIPLVAGKYVSTDTYKSFLGLDSWQNLTTAMVKRFPLKPYMFCSDEEASETPTCRRFDRGTTPSEIVDATVSDYRSYYSLTNYPNGRLRFGWWDMGSYISRLFDNFINVRQFLEETFYLLGESGGSDEEIDALLQSYVPAIAKGLKFFHGVFRGPDAPSYAMIGNARFAEEEVEAGEGMKIRLPIERKALSNILVDSSSDRLKVRGVEFDKVVALIMLTERSFGFPRYERVSLHLSYPDVERLLVEGTKPTDYPTLGLLSEILHGNVTAQASTPVGYLELPDHYKVDLTEMMRIYGILGSILNLDISGIEAADNLSAHFRMMSGFSVPGSLKAVAQTGANAASPTVLKYWAPEDAGVSTNLVSSISVLDDVAKVRAAIKDDFKTWVIAYYAQIQEQMAAAEAAANQPAAGGDATTTDTAATADPAPVVTGDPALPENQLAAKIREQLKKRFAEILAQIRFKRLQAKIDAQLKTLPESAGPRTLAELSPRILDVLNLANQLEVMAMLSEIIPDLAIAARDTLTSSKIQIANVTRNVPSLGMVLALLPAKELELKALPSLLDPGQQASDRGLMYRNAEILNSIFYEVHPEYRR